MNIAIVTVGYNRPQAIRRLLESLTKAAYGEDRVTLVISLDRGERQDELARLAEAFEWPYGNKIVRVFPERQGLRAHILQCGDLTGEYDAVVVLEDDVTVAEGFYAYVRQAITFYTDCPEIAGISLYQFRTVPYAERPFTPAQNGFDAFLLRFAQSWGQCWTRAMWTRFRTWYNKQESPLTADGIIPARIATWDDRSWLKYYIKYTAETQAYFVYPYAALSTDHSEAGEHCELQDNDFQVPLLEGVMDYRFPSVTQAVKYDAFFERIFDDSACVLPDIPGTKLLDLYGSRQDYHDADVLISTGRLPYRVLRTIALKYRPHEINCLLPDPGVGIFVYDLHQSGRKARGSDYVLARHDIGAMSWKRTLLHGLTGLKKAILKRIPGKR